MSQSVTTRTIIGEFFMIFKRNENSKQKRRKAKISILTSHDQLKVKEIKDEYKLGTVMDYFLAAPTKFFHNANYTES